MHPVYVSFLSYLSFVSCMLCCDMLSFPFLSHCGRRRCAIWFSKRQPHAATWQPLAQAALGASVSEWLPSGCLSKWVAASGCQVACTWLPEHVAAKWLQVAAKWLQVAAKWLPSGSKWLLWQVAAKWLLWQVAAKWLPEQVAAKWLLWQVAAKSLPEQVAAKWLQKQVAGSGRQVAAKWLLEQVAAKWLQVAASGCKCKWLLVAAAICSDLQPLAATCHLEKSVIVVDCRIYFSFKIWVRGLPSATEW